MEEVIIMGSGPAGLTAAIYTARAKLNPLLIAGEEVGGQLMITTDVENFPGFSKGILGPDLIESMKNQAKKFGCRFINKDVNKIDFSSYPFKLNTGKEEFITKSVIISTGARAKYLGLSSEKKFLGKGVSACATCDAAFFRDVEVGVVGGGDSAMEEANFITKFAKKVYIIHRRDEFRATKIMRERVFKNPKIEIIWNSVINEIYGKEDVEGVTIENVKTKKISNLSLKGLFIAIGHKPNTDIFQKVLNLDEKGYIITKNNTHTSIKGIFAAGDVQDPRYRQAITAAGSGCMAALDVEKWLVENE